MKNGKAYNIREELEKKFEQTQKIDVNKLNSKEPIEIESHVTSSADPADIVNLRIRTESGKRSLLLKMLATDTIDKIYELVEQYSESGDIEKFEIRTNFPRRNYLMNEMKTLKELGLAPSCALILSVLAPAVKK